MFFFLLLFCFGFIVKVRQSLSVFLVKQKRFLIERGASVSGGLVDYEFSGKFALRGINERRADIIDFQCGKFSVYLLVWFFFFVFAVDWT